jgi:hypothetical protein
MAAAERHGSASALKAELRTALLGSGAGDSFVAKVLTRELHS